ncbi:hypothetical protein KI387_042633, partial [Taxus chinensis]
IEPYDVDCVRDEDIEDGRGFWMMHLMRLEEVVDCIGLGFGGVGVIGFIDG